MKQILQKYKLPIALLLVLLLGVGIWQGWMLLGDYKVHKDRQSRFAAELDALDPYNIGITYRVPYESSLYSPRNIGLGQLDAAAQAALDKLLASLEYDAEATDNACMSTENVLISAALSEGRMAIALNGDDYCAVDITRDGVHWESALYTYDLSARDDLLACGGLPSIAEMKEAIEYNLQNQINNLGDSAKKDNKLK